MADGRVLGGDAGTAEDVAALARDVDRHAAVVPLGQRHLGRLHLAGILEATELQRQQLRGGDAPGHVGHLQLDRLVRSEEHTSELQSRRDLEGRLLLEKKKKKIRIKTVKD